MLQALIEVKTGKAPGSSGVSLEWIAASGGEFYPSLLLSSRFFVSFCFNQCLLCW